MSTDYKAEWHDHDEILEWLWSPNDWIDAIKYVKEEHLLHIAQDAFQHYVKREFQPSWIVDVRAGPYGYHPLVMSWLISEGPDDPDE